jgi:hypothetical protein
MHLSRGKFAGTIQYLQVWLEEPTRPTRVAGTSPERIALAESTLGSLIPSLLRRIYEEVADGGFGPGCGLFPVEERILASGEERDARRSARKARARS